MSICWTTLSVPQLHAHKKKMNPVRMGSCLDLRKVMPNNSDHKREISKKALVPLLIFGLYSTLIWACLGQYSYAQMKKSSFCINTQYTQEYVKENQGKVVVEIPEVYELANIAITITDYGLNNPYRVNKQGKYYKKVLDKFLPFKNHPLISKIEFSDEKIFTYLAYRENSACYEFRNDSIVSSGIYPRIRHPNPFKEHIELIEDFARKSQFREFYLDNQAFYQEQIRKYKKKVPIRKMWSWLERNFPERYNCYKIVFSPLIGATHSTQSFKDEGKNFKEIVMFISGPKDRRKKYPAKVDEGITSRVVFTEIDHNYVNPVTDQYLARINKILSDVKKWNKQSSSGYPIPFLTFNEYMTWAVFILYAYDNYSGEDFETLRQMVVKQMTDSRKFALFEQFSDRLLELYLVRKEGETVADLYPRVLEWAEKM
jgi:hypothetical protein